MRAFVGLVGVIAILGCGGSEGNATGAGGVGATSSSSHGTSSDGAGTTGAGTGGTANAGGSGTGGSGTGGAGTGGAGTGGASGGPSSPAHRFKGLADRGGDAAHGGMGVAPASPSWGRAVVNSGVMNVHWDDLQPTKADNTAHRIAATDGGATGTTYIDQYLSQYRAAIPAADRAIKLRLFAGIDAPGWVKTLSGGAVTWMGQTTGVPKFWDGQMASFDFGAPGLVSGTAPSTYLEAYAKLVHAIADVYLDPSSPKYAPEILDITISGTMTQYAEPCIRQKSDGGVAALMTAGLDATKDRNATLDVIQIHAHYVTTITSSFALDPLQGIDDTFTGVSGATEIMDMVRGALNGRGVLANNSISCNSVPTLDPGMEQPQASFMHGGQGDSYESLYGAMRDRSSVGSHDQGGFSGASPVGFQTSANGNNRYPNNDAEIRDMIDRARYFGGEYVELAGNWASDTDFTDQQANVTSRDTALEAAGP